MIVYVDGSKKVEMCYEKVFIMTSLTDYQHLFVRLDFARLILIIMCGLNREGWQNK